MSTRPAKIIETHAAPLHSMGSAWRRQITKESGPGGPWKVLRPSCRELFDRTQWGGVVIRMNRQAPACYLLPRPTVVEDIL